ncbi:hypothetical protein NDA16_003700 [Ustilago loliicola]|nr:hypothetical protein NDA16_003700 [Ustilago loliicola]
MSAKPVRCDLFAPPDDSDSKLVQLNSVPNESFFLSSAVPAKKISSAPVASDEQTVSINDRWGGRIVACQSGDLLRLFLSSNGQITDLVSASIQANEGDSVSQPVTKGKLNIKCHPLSRVAAATLETSEVILLYQNVDGAVCQRFFDEQGQAWGSEEILVQAHGVNEPVLGTTLAIYEAGHDRVLLWQNMDGVIVRKPLDGEDAHYPIKNVQVQQGAYLHVNLGRGEQLLKFYWVDYKDANVQGAVGSLAPHEVDFKLRPWLTLPYTPSALAVLEPPASSDAEAGTVFYVPNKWRRCVEYSMDGEPTGLLGPASSAIDPVCGLSCVLPANKSDEGKNITLLFFDQTSNQPIMLVRDVVDLHDDKTRVVSLVTSSDSTVTPDADTAGQKDGDNSSADKNDSRADHPEQPITKPDESSGQIHDDNLPPKKVAAVNTWIFKTCKEVLHPIRKVSAVKSGEVITKQGKNGELDKLSAVITNRDNLWPKSPQTITYGFLPGNYEGTETQRSKVRQSIEEWTYYVNVIFNEEQTDLSKCDVRIRFDPNDGSWSYVGLDCRDQPAKNPTMNLAWVQQAGSLSDKEKAVILHEFGHVLGLLHEHQSPAHGNKAVMDEEATLALYRTEQHWPDKQIYEQVINVYKSSDVSNYSQVDETSIMQYPQPKEVTGLDHDIGYPMVLSKFDKAYMVIQYPRSEPHKKAPEWTFEHALEVIGCPESVCKEIQEARKQDTNAKGDIDPTRIREILGKWAKAAHAKNGQPSHSIEDQPDGESSTKPSGGPAHGFEEDEAARAKAEKEQMEKEVKRKAAGSEGPFIEVLYKKLINFFPPGEGQYFALQFPTRYLDKASFAYDTSGVFSRFEKPVLVNEAEFRLTDAMYNLGPIVGGPNGQSLSSNYIKLLNSLIPGYEGSDSRQQRELMRSWLLNPTHHDEAAFTVDSRLAVNGLNDSDAGALSDKSSVQIVTHDADVRAGGVKDTTRSSSGRLAAAKDALEGVEAEGLTNARPMNRMEFSNTLTMEYLIAKQTWELD